MSQSKDEKNIGDNDQSLLKRAVPVEFILHDGTHLTGSVYVPASIALHNLFMALPDFIHLHRDAPDYYLVNKSYIALCKIPPDFD